MSSNLDNIFYSKEFPRLELHVQGNLDRQLTARSSALAELVGAALSAQTQTKSDNSKVTITITASDLSLPDKYPEKSKEKELLDACCKKIMSQLQPKISQSIPLRLRDVETEEKTKNVLLQSSQEKTKESSKGTIEIEMQRPLTLAENPLKGRAKDISTSYADIKEEAARLRMQQTINKVKMVALGIFLILLAVGTVATMGILAIPAIGVLAALSASALTTTLATTSCAAAALSVAGGTILYKNRGETPVQQLGRIAHFHGDLFLSDTGLERNTPMVMLPYTANLLKNKLESLRKKPVNEQNPQTIERVEKLLNSIQKGVNATQGIIENYLAQTITGNNFNALLVPLQNAVRTLQPGESIIIPGGWDAPVMLEGHAMYYEIIKDHNGTYRFKAYNTGAGLDNHDSAQILDPAAPGREPKIIQKIHPCYEIAEIAPERMCDKTFWQSLIEIRVCGKFPKDMKSKIKEKPTDRYGASDLYQKVFPTLKGKIIEHPYEKFSEEYIPPQHSNICTWAGLRALIRDHLLPIEFEHLEHEILLGSLLELHQTYSDPKDLMNNEDARGLMRISAENLAANLNREYRNGIISITELEQANALIAKVQAHVKKAEDLLHAARQKNTPSVNFVPIRQSSYAAINADFTVNDLSHGPASVVPKPTTQVWNSDWQPKIATIDAELKVFYETYRKAIKEEPLAVATCLRELFYKLPAPTSDPNDPFWGKLPKIQIDSCMESIAKLSELIVIAFGNIDYISFPNFRFEFVLCLLKGLAVEHMLACQDKQMQKIKLDKWKVTQYSVERLLDHIGVLNTWTRDENINLYDSRLILQFHEVMDYLKKGEKLDKHRHDFFDLHRYQIGAHANLEAYDSYEMSCGEVDYAINYYKDHTDEFEKSLGKEFDKLKLANIDKNFDKASKVTFALADTDGKYFPKPYCQLKRQALLLNKILSKWDQKFDLEYFQGPLLEPYFHEKQFKIKMRRGHELPENLKVENVMTTRFTPPHEYNTSEALRQRYSSSHLSYGLIADPGSDWPKDMGTESLDHDKLTELRSLFTEHSEEGENSAEELQLVKALEYFSIHLDDFQDHDIQVFFLDGFFKNQCLKKLLENNPKYIEKILSFIKKGFNYYQDPRNLHIDGACFMLHVGVLLKDKLKLFRKTDPAFQYVDEVFEKSAPDVVRNPEFFLKELLKSSKTVRESGLIYRQLVYNWLNLPEKELNAKFPEIVAAIGYLKAFPLPHEDRRRQLDHAVESLRIVRTLPILKSIHRPSDRTAIVNSVVEALKTQMDVDWNKIKWNIQQPLWIGQIDDKNIIAFNEETCEVQPLQVSRMFLPTSITMHPDFIKNFPTVKNIMAEAKGIGLYEWEDKKNGRVRVQSVGNSLIIHRQFKKDDAWYQYLPDPNYSNQIKDIPLGKEHTHWAAIPDKNKILLCKTGTNEVAYSLTISPNKKIQISDPHQPDFRLINGTQHLPKPFNLLNRFEKTAHMNIWADHITGLPKRIEMPRLELDFNLKEVNGKIRAVCSQESGFYIADNQYVKELGEFENYLVLQNDKGKIKVIIPRKCIDISKTGALTGAIKLAEEFPPVKGAQFPPYYSYEFSKKGVLQASHEAGNLYRAYLLQGQRRYKEAQNSLRLAADKPKRYSIRETEIHDWMEQVHHTTKDPDPKHSALILTATSLLWKNQQIHGKLVKEAKYDAGQMEYIKGEYLKYLENIEYIGDLQLAPYEELTIVKELVRFFDRDRFLQERLESLQNPDAHVKKYTVKTKFNQIFTVERAKTARAEAKPAEQFKAEEAIQKPLPVPAVKDHADLIQKAFSIRASLQKDKSAEELIGQLGRIKVSKEYETPSRLQEEAQKALKTDIQKFAKQPVPVSFQLHNASNRSDSLTNVIAVRSEVELRRQAVGSTADHLRSEILNLANASTASGEGPMALREISALHHAALIGAQRKPMGIDDLCVAFLRNNPAEIKERNPNLSNAAVTNLKQMLIAYLTHTTEEQAFVRQITALDAISGYIEKHDKDQNLQDDLTLKELCDKAGQEMTAHRVYKPEDNLAFLIFENSTGLRLREDQVKSIGSLSQNPFWIEQAFMGQGKSSVWLPLLALQKADGVHFPVIIVPKANYETVRNNLRETLGGAFDRAIHAMSFDRNSDFSVASLQNKLDLLHEIRQKREGLIMTNKTKRGMSGLVLKFKELLLQYKKDPKNPPLVQQLQLMQKILKLFKDNGLAIIDEADQIINAKLEVNFTIDDAEEMPPSRCQLISSVYAQLRSPEIMKLIGGDPLFQDLAILPEDYHKNIKRPLLDNIVKSILKNPKNPLHSFFDFLNTPDSKDLKLVMSYLDGSGGEESEKYVEGIGRRDPSVRDQIALLKEELNSFLPLTLNKRFRVDYGFSQKKTGSDSPQHWLAIPYSGNDCPVEGSEFRSPDIVANYTILSLWRNGIPTDVLFNIVKKLKTDAASEKLRRDLPTLDDTAGYKAFLQLCGDDKELREINFSVCSEADCKKIADKINESRKIDPERFLTLITEQILPCIKVFPKQITSNSIDLVNMFKSAVGFTGTPWNLVTYPQMMRSNTKTIEGLEGKTAVLLFEKISREPDGIRVLRDASFPNILKSLIHEKDHALIDTGAVFNTQKHEEVAKEILKLLQSRNSKQKGVVFFKNDQAMVMEPDENNNFRSKPLAESGLKPEERFTYYDQAHSTGTDISQDLLAAATLTIGKDTTLRDFAQGAWRMRKLDKLQNISLILTPEADSHIHQLYQLDKNATPAFAHTYQFLSKNQVDQQLSHLVMSIKQKIDAVVRLSVLDRLLEIDFDPKTNPEAPKLIEDLKHILVTTQSTSPFEIYGKQEKMIDKEIVIKAMIDGAQSKLQSIRDDSPLFAGKKIQFIEGVTKTIHTELSDTPELLPDKISSHISGNKKIEDQVEKEQEKQQQQIADRDVDLNKVSQYKSYSDDNFRLMRQRWWIKDPPKIFQRSTFAPIEFAKRPDYEKPGRAKEYGSVGKWDQVTDPIKGREEAPICVYALDDLLNNQPDLMRFAPIMKGLQVTPNRISPESLDVLKHKQLPTQYVLYIRDKKDGSMKMQLLDAVSDLSFFWTALNLDQKEKYPDGDKRDLELCLCSINGEVIQQDRKLDNEAFAKSMKEHGIELRVKAKLFLGELVYTKEEIPHLEKLIKQHGDLIAAFYQEKILPNDPKKALLFRNSKLYDLLGQPDWIYTVRKQALAKVAGA